MDAIRNYAIIEPRQRSTAIGMAGQIAKMSSTIPPSSAVSHRKRVMETRVANFKPNFLNNDLASERACVTQKTASLKLYQLYIIEMLYLTR